jgi:hypothetical protein
VTAAPYQRTASEQATRDALALASEVALLDRQHVLSDAITARTEERDRMTRDAAGTRAVLGEVRHDSGFDGLSLATRTLVTDRLRGLR